MSESPNETRPVPVVTSPARHVIGVAAKLAPRGHENFDPQAIPALWQTLMGNDRLMQLASGDFYGVGQVLPDGLMHYLAGFEHDATDEVADFDSMDVPAGEYFAVEHVGSLEFLGDTLGRFCSQAVPQQGLRLGDGPFVEVYSNDFNEGEPDSRFVTLFPKATA